MYREEAADRPLGGSWVKSCKPPEINSVIVTTKLVIWKGIQVILNELKTLTNVKETVPIKFSSFTDLV